MAQERATDRVEQLWYTWSTIGRDALAAGCRVRAAAPALANDLDGERMKQLDRYLRSSLPAATDPHPLLTRLREAPLCLPLICTESKERALVYKVYTGKDRRGRPGA